MRTLRNDVGDLRIFAAGAAVFAMTLLPSLGTHSQQTQLGIRGTEFTINDKPTFLFGISYYGALGAPEEAIRRDLGDIEHYGFNWIRVWATWGAFGNEVSATDGEGRAREPSLSKLQWLVAECDRRGIVVDVTLSRGNGVTGRNRLQTLEAHRRAVETIVTVLQPHRNWYLDLSNERNIKDGRFTSISDLGHLREHVRRLDAERLVTASHAGDVGPEDLYEYLWTVGVDFIALHRPRNARSSRETYAKTRRYFEWMKTYEKAVPVHYQEPFRRGFRPQQWEPSADHFITDLKQALSAHAAGWCFHNGDQKDQPDGEPRRSFDMSGKRLFEQLDAEERKVLKEIRRLAGGQETISEEGGQR